MLEKRSKIERSRVKIITIIQAILGPSSIQYEGSKLYPIPQWVASASFSYNFVVTQAIVRGMGSTKKNKSVNNAEVDGVMRQKNTKGSDMSSLGKFGKKWN